MPSECVLPFTQSMLLHVVNSLLRLLQGSILLVGHANGDVNFWELKRAAWECVKPIRYKSALALQLFCASPKRLHVLV